MKEIIKKVIRPPLALGLRLLFLFPVLPLLYAVEPFRRFRFGLISTQRLGHLAGNTEVFIRQRQVHGTNPKTRYVFAGWDPANRQLFEMYKRFLPIHESRWLTRILFNWRPILKHTRFFEPLKWQTHLHYREYNLGHGSLRFTDEEEERGRAGLREMGIGDDNWFVCFHARDPAYLASWRPQFNHLYRTRDFRNSSIESMLPAAKHIASLGGFAVRMGAIVERPLDGIDNPRIIDYATEARSDFMDIYLCAKTRFFLGTNSGLYVVSTAFDRPIALVNHLPLGAMALRGGDRYIPKLLRDTRTGGILTFADARERGLYDLSRMFQTELHQEQGSEWVENDADDILELTKEMVALLDGEQPPAEALRLQEAYRQTYLSHIPEYEFAGKLGARFALRYRYLIESEAGTNGKHLGWHTAKESAVQTRQKDV